MAEDSRLDPVAYLDRLFDVIREEARQNPKFADRLVKAMGGKVVFADEAKSSVANPYMLAGNATKAHFYSVFASMKPNEIKRVIRDNNLATTLDMRGKSAAQLIDMMYERARMKVTERKSSYF